MKNLSSQFLESKSNRTLIILLSLLTILLAIVASGWDFPNGQDACYNIAQIESKGFLARPFHGTMNILGVLFYVITDFFGGDVYFSFNLLNIACCVVFVTSIYFIFLMQTGSKTIACCSSLALFLMPNIWLMMTMHAYYSTAIAFLLLSYVFFLKRSFKYLIVSGVCLGISYMSNPSTILLAPLYLLLSNDFSKEILKPVLITIGVSFLWLLIWIVFNFESYLLSGPWNVVGLVRINLSLWGDPLNSSLMMLYAFVLNYNLFLPLMLVCSVIVYKKEKRAIVVALITLVLNFCFWNSNYGKYLMPFIVMLTVILLTYYLQLFPLKTKRVSVFLIMYIVINFAIGVFGYTVPLKNISEEYIDLVHYVINNNKDKNPELIAWDDGVNFIQYYYPGCESINLNLHWGRWDELFKKLEKGHSYYYLPLSDLPIKGLLRYFIPANVLERAHKLPKGHLSVFTKYDAGNNLKIEPMVHNNVDYYVITKVDNNK